MKKVAFALLLAVSGTLSFAQTQKGTFSLSLHNFSPHLSQASGLLAPTNAFGISFGNSESETSGTTTKYTYTTVGFNCSAQYFVINNLSIGPNVNLYFQDLKDKGTSENTYKSNISIGGLEMRYYFNAEEKYKYWISGSSAWGSATTRINGEKDDSPSKISRNSASAGISFFPMERISIDLGIGYGIFKVKDSHEDFQGNKIESTDTNKGLAADIGFSVFF
ncbi:MAG: hypothetical protein JNM22_17680 [Saprospiraceae bacterium]|nr:hypothetical protein [Saprospiraceae bacterium]